MFWRHPPCRDPRPRGQKAFRRWHDDFTLRQHISPKTKLTSARICNRLAASVGRAPGSGSAVGLPCRAPSPRRRLTHRPWGGQPGSGPGPERGPRHGSPRLCGWFSSSHPEGPRGLLPGSSQGDAEITVPPGTPRERQGVGAGAGVDGRVLGLPARRVKAARPGAIAVTRSSLPAARTGSVSEGHIHAAWCLPSSPPAAPWTVSGQTCR